MIVLDEIKADEIKTKPMAEMLAAIKAGRKVLVVLPETDNAVYKSIRNIEGAKVATVNTLNVYDILNCDSFVAAKDAVAKIEEVYA
jgi:large subunit ribosomal protein L4